MDNQATIKSAKNMSLENSYMYGKTFNHKVTVLLESIDLRSYVQSI